MKVAIEMTADDLRKACYAWVDHELSRRGMKVNKVSCVLVIDQGDVRDPDRDARRVSVRVEAEVE